MTSLVSWTAKESANFVTTSAKSGLFAAASDLSYQTSSSLGSCIWTTAQTASDFLAKAPDFLMNAYQPDRAQPNQFYETACSYGREFFNAADKINTQVTNVLSPGQIPSEIGELQNSCFSAASLIVPGLVVWLTAKNSLECAVEALWNTKQLLIGSTQQVIDIHEKESGQIIRRVRTINLSTGTLSINLLRNLTKSAGFGLLAGMTGYGIQRHLTEHGVSKQYQDIAAIALTSVLLIPYVLRSITATVNYLRTPENPERKQQRVTDV